MHEIPALILHPAHGGFGYALLPEGFFLIQRNNHIFSLPGFLVKYSLQSVFPCLWQLCPCLLYLLPGFLSLPLFFLQLFTARKIRTAILLKGISRILRKKTENSDDGYRAGINESQVDYSTTAVRLPWEITEETLSENIEGESLEATITKLMTTQLGVDCEDLYLNGDTETDSTDADYDFLKINDGWIKQISNGGHVYDASAETGMSLDMFYEALGAMPNKYNNGKLRWLM